MRIFKTQRGFTLTELLVVIFIIGVLAALVLPKVVGTKIKAQQAQARANLNKIQYALQAFQQDNNGNYPGAALYDSISVDDHTWIMRGVIGGSLVQDPDAAQNVYGNFYFDPLSDPEEFPSRRPDRLFDAGNIDGYPFNPFQQYVATGDAATGEDRPMVNLFGIEADKNSLGQDRYANWDQMINFSVPVEKSTTPISSGFMVNDGAGNPGYLFEYIGPGGYGGWWGNSEDTSNPQDWAYSGVLDEDLFTQVPLQGNFCYIPFHPLQKDYNSPDFMKYVEGYWLILYYNPKDSSRNRYGGIVPHFKDKGDGQGDGDDTTATIFERRVEEATLGASFITGTIYKPYFENR
jgi:prepilin-type N-terminal cleavage/methylation domain-containing protein